ncbi:MAG: response regulator transcription factor [Nocardiopsaceae bacterium]|nr:response regulator transcription factor [Nocardiopsaceae bacterium]
MIRVALADDQELVRTGFAALLAAEDDIEVAGQAADGLEAVGLATRAKPDVILMDIRMPGLDAAQAVPGLGDLTPREREVVALIAAGLSNEEIAGRLYVSQSTAKTHATRAMTKLAARDRAQLVVFAYQAGLARPGWAG